MHHFDTENNLLVNLSKRGAVRPGRASDSDSRGPDFDPHTWHPLECMVPSDY